MKKVILIIVAALTSIFAAFGHDLYNLFIKEKVFMNKIVQKNVSEDKKKEIEDYITKKKTTETSPEVNRTEEYNQEDLDNVIILISKIDAEFYQKVSYRYSIYSEDFLKVFAIKVNNSKKKKEEQDKKLLKFESIILQMKDFRRKYQNCSRDAKILNNDKTNIQSKETKTKVDINEMEKKELLKKEIIEKYKIEKTELDCKKLILLEFDRFFVKQNVL